MQIALFEVQTPVGPQRRLGVRIDDAGSECFADLTAAFEAYLVSETDEPTPRELALLRAPPDMIGWLRAGQEGWRAARVALEHVRRNPAVTGARGERLVYSRADIRLLPPLPRPSSLRDFSIYEEHTTKAVAPKAAGGRPYIRTEAWYRTPPYSNRACGTIGGPEDPIPYPYYTERLDLEFEVGIIVGKEGRNLTAEQARAHIAGYTILIDSTCRDGQEREPYGVTKRKDFHTAIGPYVTTADAVDPENLHCRYEVDGELWFEGTTAAPHSFSPAQLVAYVSDNEPIYPGDLIGTGTISFACSLDLGRWIKVGQTATFEIEKLGRMSLTVVPGEHVVDHIRGMKGYLSPP